MSTQQKQNLLSYLPLLIALMGIAVMWGTMTAKIDAQEEKIQTQNEQIQTLLDMKNDVAVIKNDMGYVKSALGIKN